uniref:THAP-type domain-containing protein n=1 Tax=Romanomermis culicivorax TaxID=13658 RepID=A0A915KPR9_ROMCU
MSFSVSVKGLKDGKQLVVRPKNETTPSSAGGLFSGISATFLSEIDKSNVKQEEDERMLLKKPMFCPRMGCRGVLGKIQYKNSLPFYRCTKCGKNPAIPDPPKIPEHSSKSRSQYPIKCCLVPDCMNSSAKIESWRTCKIRPFPCPRHKFEPSCLCQEPYQLIPFPPDATQRRLWLQLIGRYRTCALDDRKHAVCSLHFIDEQVTKRIPFPILNTSLKKDDSIKILKQYFDEKRVAQFKAILEEICDEEAAVNEKKLAQSRRSESVVLFDHGYKSFSTTKTIQKEHIMPLGHDYSNQPPKLENSNDVVSNQTEFENDDDAEEAPNLSSDPPEQQSHSKEKVQDPKANSKPAIPRIGVKVLSYNNPTITNAVNVPSKFNKKFCIKSGVQIRNAITVVKGEGEDCPDSVANEGIQCELEVGQSGITVSPAVAAVPNVIKHFQDQQQVKRQKIEKTDFHSKAMMREYSTLNSLPNCEGEGCAANKILCSQLIAEIKSLGNDIISLNWRKKSLSDRILKPTHCCQRCESTRRKNLELLDECRRLQILLVPGACPQNEFERRGKPISQQQKEFDFISLKRNAGVLDHDVYSELSDIKYCNPDNQFSVDINFSLIIRIGCGATVVGEVLISCNWKNLLQSEDRILEARPVHAALHYCANLCSCCSYSPCSLL